MKLGPNANESNTEAPASPSAESAQEAAPDASLEEDVFSSVSRETLEEKEAASLSGNEAAPSSIGSPGPVPAHAGGAPGEEEMMSPDEVVQHIQRGPQPESTEEEDGLEMNDDLRFFFETYRLRPDDVTLTPKEVYDRGQEEPEISSLDEEIIEALVFEGCYTRNYRLGSFGTYTFATTSPEAVRRSFNILQEMTAEGNKSNGASATMINVMSIARHLAVYMDRRTCEASPGDENFESDAAIRARYTFVSRLPVEIIDTIGDRLKQFLRRVERAADVNLPSSF